MPDKTVFVQAGIFIILLFVLSRLVFKPLQKIFLLRRNRTAELMEDAKRIGAEAKTAEESCERIMEKALFEARGEKERLLQEGLKAEADIKAAARREAAKIMADTEAKVARARGEAEARLEKDVPRLADEIVGKFVH
jgi:F-type H+-transporting ATPase subunit b